MMQVSDCELKIITDIIKNHIQDYDVWIFGSRYDGTAKEYSDLDMVIVGEHKLPLSQMADLRNAFQQSNLPFSVDILDWNKTSKEFQLVISKGYEVIYSHS
ncbi:MAG: nucleotidyltransferase domain-containing protein [Methanobrevibacter sp.]|jgi:predicted nucleotidyltransferase|nr:nucleotidyltransferase domain-containing protein [Candidatus Methanovirga basalitermitum]